MTGRKLTPDEKKAWQAVKARITPLGQRIGKNRAAKTQPGSDPSDLASSIGLPKPSVKTVFSVPQDRQNEKKVRKGRQTFSASLDLHGHTLNSAWAVLPDFLMRQKKSGASCVLVITGKGRQGEGVIRRHFLHWLETNEARRLISGYAQAHIRHGGGGAFYVYLRQAEKPS